MKATLRRKGVLGLAITLAAVAGFFYVLRKPYSLCDIAQHPSLFSGRSVVIKGTLYGYSGGLINLSGTECEETNAWATVKLSESLSTNAETEDLLTSIQRLQDRKQYVKAEVIITGDLEDLGNPCFAPKFVITGKRLAQLTPFSLVPFEPARY